MIMLVLKSLGCKAAFGVDQEAVKDDDAVDPPVSGTEASVSPLDPLIPLQHKPLLQRRDLLFTFPMEAKNS